VILSIIFLSSIVINVSILMTFARKQTLRTTSNRFLVNLLIVNILSSSLYLPLVLLSLFVTGPTDDAEPVQRLLFQSVSHFIGCISILSTLLIGMEKYVGVIHALQYHRHITRKRSNFSIALAWLLSILSAIIMTVLINIQAEIIVLIVLNIIHTVPSLLLVIIYLKIFRAAHTSSERARRNSAVSGAHSDSLTPLHLTHLDMRRLARLARTHSSHSSKSEPVLTRQSSIMSNLGVSMRRKMSSASQVIAREEGRTAKVFTISLLLLTVTWSPFYILSMVQVMSDHLPTSLSLSPLVNSLATLYAPLAAILHGYRNTKVRRELCAMFSLNCEDLPTPLPTKKLFRSLSMKEASRMRTRDRGISNSFLLELNGRKEVRKPHPGVAVEGQSLLQTLNSSQESSARSSFSSVGQAQASQTQRQPRFVLVHTDREPDGGATC